MTFEDKTLTCFDCNNEFVFGVEEQEQFQERGYTNSPKRCPECRAARKADRPAASNSYSSNTRFGSYTQRQSFPAVCSDCGKATTVPFEPKQGRPVYCSDCYRKVRNTR